MNGRMAVVAAIVSWFARGASPVDGMYWFDAQAVRAARSGEQGTRRVATDAFGRYAHCS